MAQPMTPLYCLAAWLLASTPVLAAGSDPTRPPAEFMPAPERGSAGADASSAAATPEPRRLVLQSVLVSAGRQRAIINGQSLAVGESLGPAYGNIRLLRLSETQAVVQGSGGTMVLELTPGIRKAPAGHGQAPKATARSSGFVRHPSGDTAK